ncbi:flagellar biosynthetic protein FliR [Erythrobacter sp. THAF29]|uniref:flagellar biosynthetic protein FliR n=1 Tax=Erythrobacter sp. THAF29 TaxID=2587851 RepID=UPI001269738D|nr:flagellar biosynthetic protein FliR [Erythrobacter sp. THAF29]QFT76717.1 flagellar biosynthesis protein FliR [Erythrobacter sp. THAF29]
METLDFGLGVLDEQLWQVLFLSIRCGAAFLAAPMIGGMAIPPTVRVLLALAFGLFIATWMPPPITPEMLSFAAFLAIAQEAVIGAALGVLLQIAFAIPLVAAEQIAGTMGLAIATSIDPNSGAQSGALGTYFGLILTLLFYAIGAHLLWFELLLASYQVLPAGSFVFDAASGRDIALFMGYGFATAALIAFPVVLILLLVQIVTGVISRSAPALNLFALGLPAGVLAGIAALIIVMPIIVDQFAALIEVTLDRSAQLVEQTGAMP